MATRSLIAIKNEDGSFDAIYCHWNGYPEYTGKILQEHYRDEKKVRELISHGDMSIIGPEIGDCNSFDNRDRNKCLFYHRDRQDPWDECKPKHVKDLKELKQLARDLWIEYLYIFDENEWKCIEL